MSMVELAFGKRGGGKKKMKARKTSSMSAKKTSGSGKRGRPLTKLGAKIKAVRNDPRKMLVRKVMSNHKAKTGGTVKVRWGWKLRKQGRGGKVHWMGTSSNAGHKSGSRTGRPSRSGAVKAKRARTHRKMEQKRKAFGKRKEL